MLLASAVFERLMSKIAVILTLTIQKLDFDSPVQNMSGNVHPVFRSPVFGMINRQSPVKTPDIKTSK